MSEISTTPIDDGGAVDNRQPSNRAEINRANARHSTGPRTEAGKKRSSLNALRHGITAKPSSCPPATWQPMSAIAKSFTINSARQTNWRFC
jgi:hypothetical protein